MSANLISQMNGKHTTHTLQDDLESSIYVLMWMTLMYSETSDKSQVPSFLSGVLNPTPYGVTGGFSKADFLKAQTFSHFLADRPFIVLSSSWLNYLRSDMKKGPPPHNMLMLNSYIKTLPLTLILGSRRHIREQLFSRTLNG